MTSLYEFKVETKKEKCDINYWLPFQPVLANKRQISWMLKIKQL